MESIIESKKQNSQTISDSVTAIQLSFGDNQIQQLIHRLEEPNSQIQQLSSKILRHNQLKQLKQQHQTAEAAAAASSEEKTSRVTLRHAIFSSTIDIFLNSSVHGLPHILRTKRTSFKIIWIILLISSCCICICSF